MVKKIESYYELDSEMSKNGMGSVLSQAEDIEIDRSRRYGQRIKTESIQERLLLWFNESDTKTKCDLTQNKPSYCMVVAMKKKYIKNKRGK